MGGDRVTKVVPYYSVDSAHVAMVIPYYSVDSDHVASYCGTLLYRGQ